MNHQNQPEQIAFPKKKLEQIANGAMFATISPLFDDL
jgi:hypothetical protein